MTPVTPQLHIRRILGVGRTWYKDSKTDDQTCSTAYSSGTVVEHVPRDVHKAIKHHGGAKDASVVTTSRRWPQASRGRQVQELDASELSECLLQLKAV